jgi:hypothetical protein
MKMNEREEIQALIAYLQALSSVAQSGDVKVHAETRRVIARLEKLLNN